MRRMCNVVPKAAAVAFGLWVAGPSWAQAPSPEFRSMSFDSADLGDPPVIPTGVSRDLTGSAEAPRTPSAQLRPGGAGVPGVAPGPALGGAGPSLPSGPEAGMPRATAPPGGIAAPAPSPAAPAGAPTPALAAGLGGSLGGN